MTGHQGDFWGFGTSMGLLETLIMQRQISEEKTEMRSWRGGQGQQGAPRHVSFTAESVLGLLKCTVVSEKGHQVCWQGGWFACPL